MKDISNHLKNINETKANKSELSPWIVGEYKWIKFGSQMPKGWKKVEINIGETLIAGTTEGKTSGDVKSHKHKLDGRYSNDRGVMYHNQLDSPGFVSPGVYHDTSVWKDKDVTNAIGLTGTDKNYAAGVYAELWIYTGEI